MPLKAQYDQLVAAGRRADTHQLVVLDAFDRLLDELGSQPPKRGWLIRRKPSLVRGIYLWGGVGRGKTWLMDLFYDALCDDAKRRVHFHRFMQAIHDELKHLHGQANPLQRVARKLAGDTRVLCLDEFHVTDIGDAVILAALLRALFSEGVTLVTTSNQPPDRLYLGGIQRASFLPAIDLLNLHTRVIELGGDFDYRRQVAESTGMYHWPLDDDSEQRLQQAFARLATEPLERDGVVSILSRDIPFRYRSSGMVWFDFDALCGPPRSKNDYIEVARRHHTVFVSGIPRLDGSRDDRSRRFIFLIDEFYDRRVKLMLSADAQPQALYCGERLAFEFQRTASRLREMQTAEYLALPHLA
jgi:cell division protein ZapE